jgi:L-methionine (R)-S-oxide reductase
MADYASIADDIRRELMDVGATEAMTRLVAILKARIPHYTWVGIYRREQEDLVLGPYLGKPSPHTRIPIGRGICGAAAAAQQTIIVDDVSADDRYLACSVETQSEIVVPVMRNGEVLAEIDIDSDTRAAFGRKDQELLEAAATILAERL